MEKLPRDDVANKFTLAYTALGDKFTYSSKDFPPKKEDFDFLVGFSSLTEKLLEEGKIKTHPHRVNEGGLGGVLEGLQELREGKVSGEKLVYRL